VAAQGAALLAVLAWLYLVLLHGRFWRADQRLAAAPPPAQWPSVAAVVPARNEADVIGEAIGSLLGEDYPGPFAIVLVDDGSDDGTAEVARRAAALVSSRAFRVIQAPTPAPGWTGKLWAMRAGVGEAERLLPDCRYVLFTDADIAHGPGSLKALVAKAEADGLDLVSLMARLSCAGFWEALLVPAFVFFFQKLYPFPRVNDSTSAVAAAAGGCMLVRRRALERMGGLEHIRGALIDDCSLAREMKRHGPIWLGLSETTRSLRAYNGLGAIRVMVARTAFTQLRYSYALLLGTTLAMIVAYLGPPLAAIAGAARADGLLAGLGVLGWALMTLCYVPTLRLYRRPVGEALLLPAAAFFYVLFTLDSAWAHARGAGGRWKGRSYAAP